MSTTTKAVRWGAMPYLPLNVHMYQKVDSEKPEYADLARVWPKLFSAIAPKVPEVLLSWCCAQFVVTRAAVRARPRAFYEAIYEWLNNRDLVLGNVTSFISSRVLEQTWHMIFGMPPAADILPVCDVFHCDILDVVTEQVETWEGTPFDRIPCKVYDAKHVTALVGIDQLLPGAIVDDFLFEPCGYSCNGVRGAEYFTIHITPEPHCAFVSFETNAQLSSYDALLERVLAIFRPAQFSVSIFVDNASALGSSQQALVWDYAGFAREDCCYHEFGSSSSNIAYANFAHESRPRVTL